MRSEMHTFIDRKHRVRPDAGSRPARNARGAITRNRMLAIVAAAACLGCADPSTPVSPAATSARTKQPAAHTFHYAITALREDLVAAGFDGSFSIAFDIDDAGRIAGVASVPGGYQHGYLWQNGSATDVGTLGSATLNSEAGGRGGGRMVAVASEIASTDPLDEDFCGFHTSLICRAAVWKNGVMTPLPTFGGNNAAALTHNASGQLVGLAEDGVLDNTCIPPQKSHFQAALWEHGQIHRLAPLPGDEVSMAGRNNSRGQAVGTSGLCSNTAFGGTGIGPHAVLWDHGTPKYLGNLGDQTVGYAATINDEGEVFGSASVPDGSLHAFRWTSATGMQDLGLMSADPADAVNTPFSANDRGQMVGASCDTAFGVCRGYLWQDGAFTDLNSLLPADSKLYVILPFSINESGQIAGLALDLETFEPRAFLATPVPAGATEGHAMHSGERPAVPMAVRKLLARPGQAKR